MLGRIAADQLIGGADASGYRTRRRRPWIRSRSSLVSAAFAAAQGIVRVANANMERAIRLVSVERGHDPRDFALVAFGGCGGLHACEIAQELGIRTVLVPEYAGALSALGMLLAEPRPRLCGRGPDAFGIRARIRAAGAHRAQGLARR